MGEARRRKLAGNTKPQNPRNKTAQWKLYRPSKHVKWIVLGPEKNRAQRRLDRKRQKEKMRILALRAQRKALRKELKEWKALKRAQKAKTAA